MKLAMEGNFTDTRDERVRFVAEEYDDEGDVSKYYLHSWHDAERGEGASLSSDLDYYYEIRYTSDKIQKIVGGTEGIGFLQEDCYEFSSESNPLRIQVNPHYPNLSECTVTIIHSPNPNPNLIYHISLSSIHLFSLIAPLISLFFHSVCRRDILCIARAMGLR